MSTVPGDQRNASEIDVGAESAPPGSAASEPKARKSTRERAEEKRQAKLDLVREQVESGSLVIRQMTDEERQRYPPPAQPRRLARG